MPLKKKVIFLFTSFCCSLLLVESKCTTGCELALASYYIASGLTLTQISTYLNASFSQILSYNSQLPDINSIQAFSRIDIPFSCDCINNGNLLAHIFQYSVQSGDNYSTIATETYANLTTASWLETFNSYSAGKLPVGSTINVTVNCSCGNSNVSNAYGLFITYPLRPEDTLSSVASFGNISTQLLQSFNPGVDFSTGTGLVYLPTKDTNGSLRPLTPSSREGPSVSPTMQPRNSVGAVVGISVAVVVLVLGICVYLIRRKKMRDALLHSPKAESQLAVFDRTDTSAHAGGIPVDKSVEFSYEELANSTDNFSMANKIGEGGFGAVYYAELRGEKAAIKKMAMKASKVFIAELTVLTNVHHLNLVRLIGYCTEGSLFLVYEFVENGNLSQHLRGAGRDPLPWSARVQIALDSAKGLEYIHEHTVPVYIHRDIKSDNILIDKNLHAKVADFGLAKLTKAGTTKLVGTFGYMPPEYAQYGEVSAKVDVYAFGVVLYELISAKKAVVTNGSDAESVGLVRLFEDIFRQADPPEICKLIDPRMEENYNLDEVLKMAQVARACTNEKPELRPTMRSVVVTLMNLSSATEDWNVMPFSDNHGFVNLMSGR